MKHRKHNVYIQSNRAGFSLVEVLVSIAIISLLIAITIPALGGARDRSREMGSAVNLRSIAQIFEMYTQNAKGLYPAAVPGAFYPDPNPNMGHGSIGHWQSSNFWANLFLDDYPWAEHEQMYLSPGATRDLRPAPVIVSTVSSYRYSSSFLGHPKIWSGEPILSHEWPDLEQSVRQSMVRYPSAKVLMWDVELPTIRRSLRRDRFQNLMEKSPMVFADGHTEVRIPAEANKGATNWAPYAAHAHPYLHNTRDGVYGRDY